jgi:hypothetical protein
MQVTRKLAKAIREEVVPRYRIRDKNAKGKAGQDRPRKAKSRYLLSDSTTYERAKKAICSFWGSAELLLVSRNVEDGRSLRASNARPISGEAAVPPLPLHPQNSSKQAL